jgi:hypothetical protein
MFALFSQLEPAILKDCGPLPLANYANPAIQAIQAICAAWAA